MSEPSPPYPTIGWIEVIVGSMYSGKTEELIRRLRRAHEAQVIGIDEGQFLGPDLVRVCERLARRGKRVIVAGLDQDYAGRPFEPMPQLLAIAEYITKTHAICVRCGQPANYSQRIVDVEGQVVVGAANEYEARCRRCFVPHADAPTRHVEEA